MGSNKLPTIIECPSCKRPIGRLIYVADFEPLQAIDAFGNAIEAGAAPGWIVEHPGRRMPCKLSEEESSGLFQRLRRAH
jgi:hypothetical protein